MKLARRTKGGWKYQLNTREGDCLLSLLREFPVTASSPAKISKTDADHKSVERENLLNESLAEHRKELKKHAPNLLAAAKLKRGEKGYLLTLSLEEREILLQILNDIRVGCWHALGEPEKLEPETPPASQKELFLYSLMQLTGYFEVSILNDAHAGPQSGQG